MDDTTDTDDRSTAQTQRSDIDDAFGGPSHEHEWRVGDVDNPMLEDLAAIIHERCEWAEVTGSYTDDARDETYYETGAECDASRSYRFELAYVRLLTDEDEPDVTFQRTAIDWLYDSDHQDLYSQLMDIVHDVEVGWHHGKDEIEQVSFDPDRTGGELVVRLGDEYEVGYGPGVTIDE